jgi:hypothetical protein
MPNSEILYNKYEQMARVFRFNPAHDQFSFDEFILLSENEQRLLLYLTKNYIDQYLEDQIWSLD